MCDIVSFIGDLNIFPLISMCDIVSFIGDLNIFSFDLYV
jgi:hypothetical protein